MTSAWRDQKDLGTPALVYAEETLGETLRSLSEIAERAGCYRLYSIKACPQMWVLQCIAPQVDGFAVSSLFEALLVRDIATSGQTVHITSPGMRSSDMQAITDSCDYISFNSLQQWDRCRSTARDGCGLGLRINPQLAFVKDERYDPCRRHSKLGVPLGELATLIKTESEVLAGIDGLHLHTNCDSADFSQLLATVQQVVLSRRLSCGA